MTSAENGMSRLTEIEAEIQAFVRESLLDEDYEGDDPLAGLDIDSLSLEQLLDHLEERFLILFDPEEISRQNLSSVSKLARMVDRRILAVETGRAGW